MLFDIGVRVGAACVPQLFDFVGVVLKFKPTVVSVLLAFMLVSSCVALFAYVLEPRPTQAVGLPVVSELVSAFVSALAYALVIALALALALLLALLLVLLFVARLACLLAVALPSSGSRRCCRRRC